MKTAVSSLFSEDFGVNVFMERFSILGNDFTLIVNCLPSDFNI